MNHGTMRAYEELPPLDVTSPTFVDAANRLHNWFWIAPEPVDDRFATVTELPTILRWAICNPTFSEDFYDWQPNSEQVAVYTSCGGSFSAAIDRKDPNGPVIVEDGLSDFDRTCTLNRLVLNSQISQIALFREHDDYVAPNPDIANLRQIFSGPLAFRDTVGRIWQDGNDLIVDVPHITDGPERLRRQTQNQDQPIHSMSFTAPSFQPDQIIRWVRGELFEFEQLVEDHSAENTALMWQNIMLFRGDGWRIDRLIAVPWSEIAPLWDLLEPNLATAGMRVGATTNDNLPALAVTVWHEGANMSVEMGITNQIVVQRISRALRTFAAG